jgi:hypothetical protein
MGLIACVLIYSIATAVWLVVNVVSSSEIDTRFGMSIRKWVGVVHPRVAVVAHDLLVTALAWWVAKELRYAIDPQFPVTFGLFEFPIVLLVQGLIYAWTGLYKGVWRFASLA